MDMPVQVPVDDPNADTEWNDILRQHGIIPPKPPSPTPLIEEALNEARQLAYENRLEDKDLEGLAELEDEEDEAFLEQYKKKRMAELSELQQKSVFNQVYHVQKPDYSRDVTEASKSAFVFVLLTSTQGANIESRKLELFWRDLAATFGDIKFCQMRADMCIEGYPERNTPTVLVYRDGDIKKQLVTLRELRGQETTISDFYPVLKEVGALQRDDLRLRQAQDRADAEAENKKTGSLKTGNLNAKAQDDEDSDWD